MCRNIRVLYNFAPPTTEAEVRAAALQYVRKVSGLARPSAADEMAFNAAVDAVAEATAALLDALVAETQVRTREGEKEKAKLRWEKRAIKASS
jgi:hypothetical protein